MKTVFARVNPVNGKVIINDAAQGVKLACSDNDFSTMYKWGFVQSLNEMNFSGDFSIENGVVTLNKSVEESEF
tara:strand:- start:55 stop:273 length:219 start_codon:yes stop_codon:yes gene_type:complete